MNEPTVVLLHGLGQGRGTMKPLARRLQHLGFNTLIVGYNSRRADFADMVEEASQGILSHCQPTAPIHLATHSLGSLIARCLATPADPGSALNIKRIVMLGPPNQGSEVVDAIGHLAPLRWLFGPLVSQLGTAESALPRSLPTPTSEVGIIAGYRWINPLGPMLSSGPNDGSVTVTATHLPQAPEHKDSKSEQDHIALPVSHPFMMRSQAVAHQCAHFLHYGCFDHPNGPVHDIKPE